MRKRLLRVPDYEARFLCAFLGHFFGEGPIEALPVVGNQRSTTHSAASAALIAKKGPRKLVAGGPDSLSELFLL